MTENCEPKVILTDRIVTDHYIPLVKKTDWFRTTSVQR